MFDSVDMGGTGVTNVDEWLKYCVEYSIAKAATLAAHLILDHGNDEEFKPFANATLEIDTNKDDLANREFFPELIDMAASTPNMYGYAPTYIELYKTEDEKEQIKKKKFNFTDFEGTTYPILDHRAEKELTTFATATMNIDTNKDYLVSSEPFPTPTNMAVSIPRMYRYAPINVVLYNTEDEKDQARRKVFDSMDPKRTDVMYFPQLMQTMIARELSLSTEANLMVHVMFLHYWTDTGNQENLLLTRRQRS